MAMRPVAGALTACWLFRSAFGEGTVHGRARDPLREWMESIVLPLPTNVTTELPMGFGTFTLIDGYCQGFTISDVLSEDLNDGLTLGVDLRITGVGLNCFINGYNVDPWDDADSGPTRLNVTVGGSSLNATLKLNPYYSFMVPELPLPMGEVLVPNCSANLHLTDLASNGSGSLHQFVEDTSDGINSMIAMIVSGPACTAFTEFLEVNGTSFLADAADLVSMMLFPPMEVEAPEVLTPTLDWGNYPLVQVVQALLTERFPLFSDRVLQLLKVIEMNATVFTHENMGLDVVNIGIEGAGGGEKPGLAVIAE